MRKFLDCHSSQIRRDTMLAFNINIAISNFVVCVDKGLCVVTKPYSPKLREEFGGTLREPMIPIRLDKGRTGLAMLQTSQ